MPLLFLSCSTGMQLAAIDACHEQVGNKQQEQQQKETTTKGNNNNNNNNNNQQSTVNSPKSWEDCHYYHWRLWTVGSSTSAWSPMLDLVGWGKRWTRWTLIWYNRICLKKPPWRMQKKQAWGNFDEFWVCIFSLSHCYMCLFIRIFFEMYIHTHVIYNNYCLFISFIQSWLVICQLEIPTTNKNMFMSHSEELRSVDTWEALQNVPSWKFNITPEKLPAK